MDLFWRRGNKKINGIFRVFSLLAVFFLFCYLSVRKRYLAATILLLLASFFSLAFRFEKRRRSPREMVLLAILAAAAAVGRLPFAALPSVQPTTFLIILTGAAYGPGSGFTVGSLAAVVSNLFLGEGPWTPWQMIAWGFIGLFSGWLRNSFLLTALPGRICFGLFCGFFFGWLMNLWMVISLMKTMSASQILAFYMASFPFDFAHGLTNAFLLGTFWNSWWKVLNRFRQKYGIFGG